MFVIIYALLGFVQESQILQICYNVEHFSDILFQYIFHCFGTVKGEPPAPLNEYTCRVSGFAEIELFVISFGLSIFNISWFGSRP